MEFNLLKFKERNIYQHDKQSKNVKYEKLLNNLLGINSNNDSAVFTKLTSWNKDLFKLLTPLQVQTLWSSSDFSLKLRNVSIPFINEKFYNFKEDREALLEELSQTSLIISEVSKKAILEGNESNLEGVKEKLKNNSTVFAHNWKKYQKQVKTNFDQSNVWPLFVGTYFIQGTLGGKAINAPLILKEVEIDINSTSEVNIKAKNKSLILNDKLIFFMEQALGINLPYLESDKDEISFKQLELELDFYFKSKKILEIEEINYNVLFPNLKVQDIKVVDFVKVGGNVLLMCQPSGGALRDATINLIETNQIDNLLTVDDLLIDHQEEAVKNIIIDEKAIMRVCQTDITQERAIISSLHNSSIIIGPPGTGKSQTISNLLANILYQNKTALFISQKKVALEVVLDRMGELKNFMLSLVESHNKNNSEQKEDFYKRIRTFLNFLIKGEESNEHKNPSPLVSPDIRKYWKYCENLDKKHIKTFEWILKNHYEEIKESFNKVKLIYNYFNDMKMNWSLEQIDLLLVNDVKKISDIANMLKIKSKSFFGFKKYNWETKTLFKKILLTKELMKEANFRIDLVRAIIQLEKFENFNTMYEFYKFAKESTEFNESIKLTTNYKSDISIILKKIIYEAKKRFRDLQIKDKSKMQKLNGRIERGYTIPSTLCNLFKDELKKLFKIVVATPEVLSTFVDFKKDKYDYVIFDEASQIFLEKAIPYISLGKTIIISGDDQQMQPSNWFNSRTDGEQDSEEAENIDSLLNYGISKTLPKYILETNYRSSSAALTTFSSKNFYNSDLKSVDKVNIKINPIEVVNMAGEWTDNTNLIEAEKMIELLRENVNKYEKICLLTLNKNQLDLVENLLLQKSPELYDLINQDKLICKNLENIQGDEADLVIISIAYTRSAGIFSTYVGRQGGRNALNVAITRAKEKLIVLKSIYSNELNISNENNQDLLTFRDWLIFLEMNSKDQKEYAIKENENNQSVESNFEKEVYDWLLNQKLNKKIKLVTQYPIGSYRIDLALLDDNTNDYLLGIEVDGYKYHSTPSQKANDIQRQANIESKGYKLIRITELLWKINKEIVLKIIEDNL